MVNVYRVIDNKYFIRYGKKVYISKLKVEYTISYDGNGNMEYIIFK